MKNRQLFAVDLFAGAGGLGEGFSQAGFDVILSVDNDECAAATLGTRVMFRVLKQMDKASLYWDYVRGDIALDRVLNIYPLVEEEVDSRVMVETISEDSREGILDAIEKRMKKAGATNLTVLLGGPPCQTYSVIGRAVRSSRIDELLKDPRQRLFEHYLFFLEKLQPDVFVFENVPAIASATLDGKKIIDILFETFDGLGYVIPGSRSKQAKGKVYVLNSLYFGIPQKRRRLILIGYRRGIKNFNIDQIYQIIMERYSERERGYPVVRDAIGDLPVLRPGEGNDRWYGYYPDSVEVSEYASMLREDSEGVLNHKAKTYREDEKERYRYFISRSLDGVKAQLDLLKKERPDLLPPHKNLDGFRDRYNVQSWDAPSSTIVAHLGKEGRHCIHPDINQLRSFTVREAARCQSFPDNYFFEGPRCKQFFQVGNAVPPLMAFKIAQCLREILEDGGYINNNLNLRSRKNEGLPLLQEDAYVLKSCR
jgi:DNA (cytosine-5)-methyltransferase 1